MADGIRIRHEWMNDPRNLVIVLLGVTTLLLGGALGRERWAGFVGERRPSAEGEAVAVLDVVLDRENLAFLDFLLDRPVGQDLVGDVLEDAATIRPALGGTWRWEGASVLRFEPAGGFRVATRYDFALVGERLLPPGYRGPSVVSCRCHGRRAVHRVDPPVPLRISAQRNELTWSDGSSRVRRTRCTSPRVSGRSTRLS